MCIPWQTLITQSDDPGFCRSQVFCPSRCHFLPFSPASCVFKEKECLWIWSGLQRKESSLDFWTVIVTVFWPILVAILNYRVSILSLMKLYRFQLWLAKTKVGEPNVWLVSPWGGNHPPCTENNGNELMSLHLPFALMGNLRHHFFRHVD